MPRGERRTYRLRVRISVETIFLFRVPYVKRRFFTLSMVVFQFAGLSRFPVKTYARKYRKLTDDYGPARYLRIYLSTDGYKTVMHFVLSMMVIWLLVFYGAHHVSTYIQLKYNVCCRRWSVTSLSYRNYIFSYLFYGRSYVSARSRPPLSRSFIAFAIYSKNPDCRTRAIPGPNPGWRCRVILREIIYHLYLLFYSLYDVLD